MSCEPRQQPANQLTHAESLHVYKINTRAQFICKPVADLLARNIAGVPR